MAAGGRAVELYRAEQQNQPQQQPKPTPPRECVVLMVVQPGERNVCDQRALELALWAGHRVRTVRRTLAEIAASAALDPHSGALLLPPLPPAHSNNDDTSTDSKSAVAVEAALVYYRAGYRPQDFPDEACWAARALLERSMAVKAPTIGDQLAGTKRVQAALAAPGGFERFASSPAAAAALRALTAGLCALGGDGHGDGDGDGDGHDSGANAANAAAECAAVARALADPGAYVLKPLREGGGNNLYHAALHACLSRCTKAQRAAYVLMERIVPPATPNALVVHGVLRDVAPVVAELGVYAVHLCCGADVVCSEAAGYLLRTKPADADDGGVHSGIAALDTPALY